MSSAPSFFTPLESLRGIAALLVVFLHLPLWNEVFDVRFVHNATLMVQFFFVLSGFVIYHSYAEKLLTPRDGMQFMWLRFGRLYPVHLVFLIGFIGIECVKLIAANYGVHSPNTRPFEEGGFGVIVQHLLLIQSLGFTDDAESFNAVSWSISTEFYTYILFALIVLYTPRWLFLPLTGVIACAAIGVWAYHAYDPYPFKPMLSCLAGFFVGCITYQAYRNWGTGSKGSGPSIFALILMTLMLCFKPPHIAADVMIYPLSALVIFTVACAPKAMIPRALEIRPLRFLGLISYSLYMAHPLVIWVMNQAVRFGLKPPERAVSDGVVPTLNAAQSLIIYPLTLGVILLVATLSYYLIEAPCRHYSRKFVGRG